MSAVIPCSAFFTESGTQGWEDWEGWERSSASSELSISPVATGSLASPAILGTGTAQAFGRTGT